MADFSLNVKINGAEQVVTTVGQIEEALRQTREELKNVAIGSQEFQKLSDQAVTLQREFVNSYKETTNFNKNIQELAGSVGSLASSVTAAFSITTTAFAAFGSESEDLSQTQVKAQQALALAIGATTLAVNAKTIAEDINNVGLALQNGLTKLLTASLGQQTIATAAQAVATGTATVAQRALNAAMAANPIGLVLAAVTALIGAFFLFGKEEQKTYTYTKDLNEEIDNNTKAIKDNISAQKELTNLQGKIAEASAKTEAAKLEARINTQKQIDELNKQSVQSDINANEAKIKNASKYFTTGASFVEAQYKRTKDLQDFNLESQLGAQDREYLALVRSKDLGFISEKAYTEGVIEVYKKYYSTQDKQRREDFQKQVSQYDALLVQRNKLSNDLNIANQTITDNEKLAELQRQQQREADYKKYKDNLDKRKQALEDYNKDVEKLEKDRLNREKELNRQLEDFNLDRISLVKGADGVFREDLIAGYDETIAKLKSSRDRNLEDERQSFEDSLKSFKESEQKKLDNNGKRVISDATINAEIDKRRKQFDDEQVLRSKTYNDQIVTIEQERAAKVVEIDAVLKEELQYGDNNLADSRKQITLDQLQFDLQIKQRELELQRKSTFDKLVEFGKEADEKKKSQIELLMEIQRIEGEVRKQQLAAAISNNNIERDQALKNVQGTEEQKGKQREDILKYYLDRESNLKKEYAMKDAEAERKNLEDLWAARNANLEKWTQFGANVANTILGLFNAVNELNKVNMENELMSIRDMTANQTSVLNEQYNQQKEDLDAKLKAGVISQEQYNNTINDLNNKLDADTTSLNKKQKAEELKLKKKAFEDDKKLKIAQAIIAGLQGAVQAFTGAFVLGPIAGPIVGGILAGLVAATTAVQVAAIRKTQFDAGAPEITQPNTGGAGAAATGGGGQVTQGSTGGFTGFSPSLTGPSFGTPGAPPQPGGTTGPMKVYVVESDITSSQNRVRTLESNATFG